MNCGSSSSRRARSHLPTRVTRSPLSAVPFRARRRGRAHRPELQQLERAAAGADPPLHEQHRPRRSSLIASGDQAEQREARSSEADAGNEHAEQRARTTAGRATAGTFRKDDAGGRQRLERELPGQPFVALGRVLDGDAAREARFEQRRKRRAPAALGERHHDPVRPNLVDDLRQAIDRAEPRRAPGACPGDGIVDHADDAPAAPGPRGDRPDHQRRQRRRADHENPFMIGLGIRNTSVETSRELRRSVGKFRRDNARIRIADVVLSPRFTSGNQMMSPGSTSKLCWSGVRAGVGPAIAVRALFGVSLSNANGIWRLPAPWRRSTTIRPRSAYSVRPPPSRADPARSTGFSDRSGRASSLLP